MALSELLHVLVATGKDPIVVACRFLFIIGRPLEHAGTVVMIVQRLPETDAELLPLDLLRIQVGNEGQEGLIQSELTRAGASPSTLQQNASAAGGTAAPTQGAAGITSLSVTPRGTGAGPWSTDQLAAQDRTDARA